MGARGSARVHVVSFRPPDQEDLTVPVAPTQAPPVQPPGLIEIGLPVR
jgi:hypothetical protein